MEPTTPTPEPLPPMEIGQCFVLANSQGAIYSSIFKVVRTTKARAFLVQVNGSPDFQRQALLQPKKGRYLFSEDCGAYPSTQLLPLTDEVQARLDKIALRERIRVELTRVLDTLPRYSTQGLEQLQAALTPFLLPVK